MKIILFQLLLSWQRPQAPFSRRIWSTLWLFEPIFQGYGPGHRFIETLPYIYIYVCISYICVYVYYIDIHIYIYIYVHMYICITSICTLRARKIGFHISTYWRWRTQIGTISLPWRGTCSSRLASFECLFSVCSICISYFRARGFRHCISMVRFD